MRRPNAIYIQVELSHRDAENRLTKQVVWVPQLAEMEVGMGIRLLHDERLWTLERMFTTLPCEVIHSNRDWRVGGVEPQLEMPHVDSV